MNDDITWFDQRPTHPQRPVAYHNAIAASNAMWATVDREIERGLAAGQMDYQMVAEMQKAERIIATLQNAEYDAWQAEIAATLAQFDMEPEPSQYAEHYAAVLP